MVGRRPDPRSFLSLLNHGLCVRHVARARLSAPAPLFDLPRGVNPLMDMPIGGWRKRGKRGMLGVVKMLGAPRRRGRRHERGKRGILG